MKNSRSLRMNPHSSVPAKSGAAAGRDGGGLGITAIAVIAALLVGMIGIFDVAAGAAPQIGESAPDFTAVDAEGNPIRLSQYRGKTVVLEWTNADCPYARRQYSTGNMQSVQALAQKDGIVWLTVISPAAGKLRAVNGAAADALTVSRHADPTAVLLDPTGSVARMYARQHHAANVRDRQAWDAQVHGRHGQHRDHRRGGHRTRRTIFEGSDAGGGCWRSGAARRNPASRLLDRILEAMLGMASERV